METSICFSQYFVDKQNVRSFSNITKTRLLNSEEAFFRHIFKDDSIKELSSDFLQVLSSFKTNLKEKSKQDFRNYFASNKISAKNLDIINKVDIFNGCWKALSDIIPRSFYGNSHNERIFQKLVQIIIYSMRRQHINIRQNVKKWDFSVHPWNTICGHNMCISILYHILVWILQYVLGTIISSNFYVTTCKLDSDEYKLNFFWKHQWQSFYDRKIVDMLKKEVINRFDTYCSGKKVKRIHSYNKKTKLKTIRKDIPKLHLILKSNNDCRPIVRYKNNIISTTEKYRIKDRLNFLKVLAGKQPKKFETQFAAIYQRWIRLNKPKLYFVKADLTNAFGSIDRNALMKILDEKYNYLKTEKYTKQYKDMIKELRKPILVRAGSTVFVWKKGLVQGYKYSPALSELYYTHMDEVFFSEHLQDVDTGIKLFTRAVDDYLYITDSLDGAQSFLKALSNYKNINYDKTVVNFHHPSIKFSDQITFLGYTYDTATMHVCRASNVYTGQMCYKIAFTQAITDINKFLEQRVGQSSIQINGHLFNLYRNSDEAVWSHVFTTLCLSANKFCTILAILCDPNEMKQYLTVYKKRVTVKLCNGIIDTLLKNKPIDYNFLYCINHFRYLSWKALMLCAQQTPKCNGLVPYIADELAKSNCIFGKWKEHARRIGSDGKCLRPAVKEVCRRTDWRLIMKKIDTLPKGFQCYHHKKIVSSVK